MDKRNIGMMGSEKWRLGHGLKMSNVNGLLPKTSPVMLGWPRGNLFQRRHIRLDFFTRPHGPHGRIWEVIKFNGSGRDDSMGLFGACVESLVPLALPRRNLIAPSEKTSPRPSQNGWVPFCSEMQPLIWATASQTSNAKGNPNVK